MKRFTLWIIAALVVLLPGVVFGGTLTGIRYAPSGSDGSFNRLGVEVKYGMDQVCSTLVEVHEMLGTARHSKKLSLDTIAGNPTIDSIAGGTVWATNQITIGASGDPVTTLDTASTDDTLLITIGGKLRAIVCTDR